jgi:hypothetical protein
MCTHRGHGDKTTVLQCSKNPAPRITWAIVNLAGLYECLTELRRQERSPCAADQPR